MKLVARKPSQRRAELFGKGLQTIGAAVGSLPLGVRPAPWAVRLRLRRPSLSRAQTLGQAMNTVGSAIGGLPVTVRPGERPRAVKVGVPATIVVVVGVAVAARRRRRARQDRPGGEVALHDAGPHATPASGPASGQIGLRDTGSAASESATGPGAGQIGLPEAG